MGAPPGFDDVIDRFLYREAEKWISSAPWSFRQSA
jgi:hypothetical protein